MSEPILETITDGGEVNYYALLSVWEDDDGNDIQEFYNTLKLWFELDWYDRYLSDVYNYPQTFLPTVRLVRVTLLQVQLFYRKYMTQ